MSPWYVCVCVHHSVVSDSLPLPWTIAGQVSLSMEFFEARILTLLICIICFVGALTAGFSETI